MDDGDAGARDRRRRLQLARHEEERQPAARPRHIRSAAVKLHTDRKRQPVVGRKAEGRGPAARQTVCFSAALGVTPVACAVVAALPLCGAGLKGRLRGQDWPPHKSPYFDRTAHRFSSSRNGTWGELGKIAAVLLPLKNEFGI